MMCDLEQISLMVDLVNDHVDYDRSLLVQYILLNWASTTAYISMPGITQDRVKCIFFCNDAG